MTNLHSNMTAQELVDKLRALSGRLPAEASEGREFLLEAIKVITETHNAGVRIRVKNQLLYDTFRTSMCSWEPAADYTKLDQERAMHFWQNHTGDSTSLGDMARFAAAVRLQEQKKRRRGWFW